MQPWCKSPDRLRGSTLDGEALVRFQAAALKCEKALDPEMGLVRIVFRTEERSDEENEQEQHPGLEEHHLLG